MADRSNPDHAAWVARLRAIAEHDAEGLFDLHLDALGVADLLPVALGEYQTTDTDEVVTVRLEHGARDTIAGPYVSVTTRARLPRHRRTAAVADTLNDALADERDRVERVDGSDVLDASRPCSAAAVQLADGSDASSAELLRVNLTIDGAAVPATLLRTGDIWAALLTMTDREALIVGRGIAPREVRLCRVTDPVPYQRGRMAMLRETGNTGDAQPSMLLEPVTGLIAVRVLVGHDLTQRDRTRQELTERRRPRVPTAMNRRRQLLWRRAEREVAACRGCEPRLASDIVVSITNHIAQLCEHAAWFADDERLRETAIDETLRYAVLDEWVASMPAQHAWDEYWASRHAWGVELNTVDDLLTATNHHIDDGALPRWLAAWRQWVDAST